MTAEGKFYLFVPTDRTSNFAFAELYTKAGKMNAAQFLRNLIAAVPYTIHIVLTDSGIQFTNRASDRNAVATISASTADVPADNVQPRCPCPVL